MSTGIQWTDETWNPTRGCSRVSKGCENCYAEVVAARFSGKGQAYEGLARRTSKGEARWTGKVVVVDKQIDWPLRWKGSSRAREEGRSSRIFVDSMSDLFHEKITDEELDRIFAVMALADRHTFQILTKRPERMLRYMTQRDVLPLSFSRKLGGSSIHKTPCDRVYAIARQNPDCRKELLWPLPNVWLGVSAENQETADERIPLLMQTPAAVRFISAEPLLGSLDLSLYLEEEGYIGTDYVRPLDWVIVGGESGADARPCDLASLRGVLQQCEQESVPCFVKQMGKWMLGDHSGFTVNRWLLEDGRVFVPPIIRSVFNGHLHDRPAGAIAFGNCDTHGGNWAEWPNDLRVRQFPAEVAVHV